MRSRLFGLLASFLFALSCMTPAQADSRPNIILILADDMGYADLGVHGCTDIQTPSLDRLAATGVTCSSGYVTHPFCGPSRAGLLTGRYQHRFGFETNLAYDPANPYYGLDASQTTFVKRLQDAGYRTGGVGKWHLGAAPNFHPNNRGFYYFYGFLGGGHDYFQIDMLAPVAEGYEQPLVRNSQTASFAGYLTDALSTDAVEFIQRNADSENPFFLYVSYNAPHAPLQALEADMDKHKHIGDWKRRTYAGMVHAMDRGIGRILETLDQQGIAEQTIVAFLSDNGGALPTERLPQGGNGASNAPLRGGKGSMYEGGDRVPFLIRWPGRLPQGVTYDRPVISLDLAMTAIKVADADAESGSPLEGVNLIPYLTGEREGDPHDAIYWRRRNGIAWAVRAGNFKALKPDWNSKDIEVYDLSKDLKETNDLAAIKPERRDHLRGLYDQWNRANINFSFYDYKRYHEVRDSFYKDDLRPK